MSRVAVARTQLSRVGVLPALRRMAAADIAALGYSSQLGQDLLVTNEPDVSQYARRIVWVRDGRIVRDYEVADRRRAVEDRGG